MEAIEYNNKKGNRRRVEMSFLFREKFQKGIVIVSGDTRREVYAGVRNIFLLLDHACIIHNVTTFFCSLITLYAERTSIQLSEDGAENPRNISFLELRNINQTH